MTDLGDRDVCRICGGVIVAVKNPRVISLTAGLWVHTGPLRRFRKHTPVPEWSPEEEE